MGRRNRKRMRRRKNCEWIKSSRREDRAEFLAIHPKQITSLLRVIVKVEAKKTNFKIIRKTSVIPGYPQGVKFSKTYSDLSPSFLFLQEQQHALLIVYRSGNQNSWRSSGLYCIIAAMVEQGDKLFNHSAAVLSCVSLAKCIFICRLSFAIQND